jgi:hypothetical protein
MYRTSIILEGTPLHCQRTGDLVKDYVELAFSLSENEILIGVFSTADQDFALDVTDPDLYTHYHHQSFSARRFFAVDKKVAQRFQMAR